MDLIGRLMGIAVVTESRMLLKAWNGDAGWHVIADDHEVIRRAKPGIKLGRAQEPQPGREYHGYVNEKGHITHHWTGSRVKRGLPWGRE